ncbi:MAG: hypothetical protein Q4G33_11180 [bacterium]|nr:hypothetical protein [bacterium]
MDNMLEKTAAFFENRLNGYYEHMLTNIEGADEFYKFTAKRLPMKSAFLKKQDLPMSGL